MKPHIFHVQRQTDDKDTEQKTVMLQAGPRKQMTISINAINAMLWITGLVHLFVMT